MIFPKPVKLKVLESLLCFSVLCAVRFLVVCHESFIGSFDVLLLAADFTFVSAGSLRILIWDCGFTLGHKVSSTLGSRWQRWNCCRFFWSEVMNLAL